MLKKSFLCDTKTLIFFLAWWKSRNQSWGRRTPGTTGTPGTPRDPWWNTHNPRDPFQSPESPRTPLDPNNFSGTKERLYKTSNVASNQTRWYNKRILRKSYSVPWDVSWIENYKLYTACIDYFIIYWFLQFTTVNVSLFTNNLFSITQLKQ